VKKHLEVTGRTMTNDSIGRRSQTARTQAGKEWNQKIHHEKNKPQICLADRIFQQGNSKGLQILLRALRTSEDEEEKRYAQNMNKNSISIEI
jgi:hypothetical protein